MPAVKHARKQASRIVPYRRNGLTSIVFRRTALDHLQALVEHDASQVVKNDENKQCNQQSVHAAEKVAEG